MSSFPNKERLQEGSPVRGALRVAQHGAHKLTPALAGLRGHCPARLGLLSSSRGAGLCGHKEDVARNYHQIVSNSLYSQACFTFSCCVWPLFIAAKKKLFFHFFPPVLPYQANSPFSWKLIYPLFILIFVRVILGMFYFIISQLRTVVTLGYKAANYSVSDFTVCHACSAACQFLRISNKKIVCRVLCESSLRNVAYAASLQCSTSPNQNSFTSKGICISWKTW